MMGGFNPVINMSENNQNRAFAAAMAVLMASLIPSTSKALQNDKGHAKQKSKAQSQAVQVIHPVIDYLAQKALNQHARSARSGANKKSTFRTTFTCGPMFYRIAYKPGTSSSDAWVRVIQEDFQSLGLYRPTSIIFAWRYDKQSQAIKQCVEYTKFAPGQFAPGKTFPQRCDVKRVNRFMEKVVRDYTSCRYNTKSKGHRTP
jgi:hypothetical protein